MNVDAGLLFRFAVAAAQDHVDPVVGQDEAAGAGFRGDLGRERPHAGGQDRGHEARSVGLDEFSLANRLAGHHGGARDRAGQLLDGVRSLGATQEQWAGGGRRPDLPLDVVGRHHMAHADIDLGDQDLDRIDLGNRLRGCGGRIRPSRQQCGKSACRNRHAEHDETRGFHTLHFPRSRLRPNAAVDGDFTSETSIHG
jgi:hypothetical protein